MLLRALLWPFQQVLELENLQRTFQMCLISQLLKVPIIFVPKITPAILPYLIYGLLSRYFKIYTVKSWFGYVFQLLKPRIQNRNRKMSK